MAKKSAPKLDIVQGSILRFKGYSPDAKIDEALLQEGDFVRVIPYDQPASPVNEDHVTAFLDGKGPLFVEVIGRLDEDGDEIVDDVFVMEIEPKVFTLEDYNDYKESLDRDQGTLALEGEADAEPSNEVVKEEDTKPLVIVPKKKRNVGNKKSDGLESLPQDSGIEAHLVSVETSEVMDFVQSPDLHATALRLARVRSKSSLALAAVLTQLHDEGSYRDVDPERYAHGNGSFKRYIEDYFSGTVEYKTSIEMINAFKFLQSQGISIEIMDEIGYAKINKIKMLADKRPDLIGEFVERAKSLSRDNLTKEIENALVVTTVTETVEEGVTVQKMEWKVRVLPEEHTFIMSRVREFREAYPEMAGNDGTAMYHIVQEWAGDHSNIRPSLEEAMASLGARYGVSLKVDD